MSNQPLVSVLMTAYNRERYIAEAIKSVLNSTYKNFELIIVDDGSKDNTVEIAHSYAAKDARIKVFINENNLGDYPNRNKAATYAKGKYIKYLDADDIVYYYGLEVMVNYMESFPDAGFGLASIVSKNQPFPICIGPKQIYFEHFAGKGHFDRAPGSSIIKLDAFKKVDGFSGARMIGDYELWLKIARYYHMVKFPFDLYWNRAHEDQESKSEYAKNYGMLKRNVLSEALSHSECPLNDFELKRLKNIIKRQGRKNTFLSILSILKSH